MVSLTAQLAIDSLFPRGVEPYLLGGLLVGLGVLIVYATTGFIAGASTVLETSWSYVSTLPRFNRTAFTADRRWHLVFTLGIVSGAALYGLVLEPGAWTTDVQWYRLLIGGFLVGVGTRLGKGCTSGHGVCGVGSASRASLANVATFLVFAVGTAQLVAALGVVP